MVYRPPDFVKFYERTSHRTFNSALRVAAGDYDLAKDATQEAYIVMYQKWDARRLHPEEANRRYVVGIAVKKVSDWFRRYKYFELDPEFDAAADDPGFANALAEMSVISPARALIDCQPPGRRAIGILFFIEEIHDYGEIASRLELSESTIRNQIKRLRDRLQALMHQVNETSRGANGHDR